MSRGRHRRPGRTVPVLASTLSLSAGAAVLTLGGTSAHAAVLPSPPDTDATPALPPVKVLPDVVTVGKGEYLSEIARNDCGNPADWTGLYERNKSTIGGNPDLVTPGQRLVLNCRIAVVEIPRAPRPEALPARRAVTTPIASTDAHVGTEGMGSFQACVITRESGGRSQVMNGSGHYGLYQFDYGTWVSGGGAGADFGHASVSEQNRVFANVYAARGSEPWSPSDHC
jgi:hypothetical protein